MLNCLLLFSLLVRYSIFISYANINFCLFFGVYVNMFMKWVTHRRCCYSWWVQIFFCRTNNYSESDHNLVWRWKCWNSLRISIISGRSNDYYFGPMLISANVLFFGFCFCSVANRIIGRFTRWLANLHDIIYLDLIFMSHVYKDSTTYGPWNGYSNSSHVYVMFVSLSLSFSSLLFIRLT